MNAELSQTYGTACKVVLLGDVGVGKTSIISRYVENTFSEICLTTTGGSFASKIMHFPEQDKIIRFEIWDTAGQEKYRSLAKIYYHNCNVAMLVYDITRASSFEAIKNSWYPILKENANYQNKVFALVGNKHDKYEEEEVPELEVKEWAKEIGAIFQYTSAKCGIGIDELFNKIGTQLMKSDKNLDFLNENVNESIRIEAKKHFNKKEKQKEEKCGC